MLVKVTNYCSAGCSHCMEDSTRRGTHMTEETFRKALSFTKRIERVALEAGCPPMLLLSGGECTEHPEIVRFVEIVVEEGFFPLLITNGLWLANEELRAALLRPEWPKMLVQVTNDDRFYPQPLPVRVEDRRIVYSERLPGGLLPLGRAARRRGEDQKKAPSSFNLRSITRSMRAVAFIRARALLGGLNGQCTPSVCDNGDVMAGESRNCFRIGTVDSSEEELTRALVDMKCNRCGLVGNLTHEQKRAIGESLLFSPYES